MATLAGLPYVALRFNKDGTRADAGPLRPAGVTDLIVVSHGWHQDPDDAEQMYAAMLTQLQAVAGNAFAGRTFGVVGIFWPSDQFKDNLSPETVAVLGGGGAAAVGHDVGLADLRKRARHLGPALFDMTPEKLEELVTNAATGGAGDADALLNALRRKLSTANVDAETLAEHGELLDPSVPGREVIASLKMAGARGVAAKAAGGNQAQSLGVSAGGGAASPALGFLSGPIAAVATLLNQAAYFEMKKRAGAVGAALGGLLDADGLADVQRLHLVGHSFGARLVTAAASAMTLKPHSLTMLQGAFSHNALGVNIKPGLNGAYRNVVADSKVTERIVITHTWNDHAVGVAYAIASRASNEIAAGLIHVTDSFGGAQDLHGGMGANGALRLKPGEGTEAAIDGASIPGLAGGVCNLHCDFIKNHSDIRTPQVARVLVAALK
jgi:hypothetical protein